MENIKNLFDDTPCKFLTLMAVPDPVNLATLKTRMGATLGFIVEELPHANDEENFLAVSDYAAAHREQSAAYQHQPTRYDTRPSIRYARQALRQGGTILRVTAPDYASWEDVCNDVFGIPDTND